MPKVPPYAFNKVIIHVSGGIADVYDKPSGIEVVIRDYDHDGRPKVVRQVYAAQRRIFRGREIDPYPVVRLRCGCRKDTRDGVFVFRCERHGGPC